MSTGRPNRTSQPTTSDAPRDGRRRGTFALCLGTALVIMEANVVNVAIPDIRAELHADAAAGLWTVDSYTLTLASLLLTTGRLGDRIGPRRGYQLGLIVFALASAGCSAADSPAEMAIARAGQGVGAALLVPAPLALLARMYPEPHERARVIALWVSVGGLGFATGPLLGGMLLSGFGWRSIFLINIPVAALTVWLTARYVSDIPPRSTALDLRGQLLAIAGLSALTFGIVQSSVSGWRAALVVGPVLGGLVSLAGLLGSQRRRGRADPHVLLPPPVVGVRPVRAGLVGGFVYNFALYGTLFVLTFTFQTDRHYSPLATGVAFLPLTVAAIGSSTLLAPPFLRRLSPREGLTIGMTVSAAGLAWLALGAGVTPFIGLVPGFLLFAVGMGLSAPAQTLLVMNHAADEHKNMASSLLNTTRQTGGVLGVALLGAIAAGHTSSAGQTTAIAVAAGACLFVAGTASILVPTATRTTAPVSPNAPENS